ncbi:hypothetical protein NFJ02_13g13760 [Pycnococcus provasolii]
MGASSSRGGATDVRERHPELVEAEVKKIQAEEEALRRRTDMEMEEKRAAVEALRRKTDVEVEEKRAAVEEKRAAVEEKRWSSVRSVAPLALGVSLAVGLAADYYLHENPAYLKRRVLAALRATSTGPRVRAESVAQEYRLPSSSRSPLSAGFVPTMLLGPTGCGKSTLLRDFAAAVTSGRQGGKPRAPALLVRMRIPSRQPLHVAGESARVDPSSRVEDAEAARSLMDSTASQVYAQIGFPPRRSIMSELFEKGVRLRSSVGDFEVNVATRARLVYALRLLFESAESLYFERVREGIAQEHAAPVVLFDEVQDLIKDDRLARAGGKYVFEYLGTLLVSYCVDRRVARGVVAGSSAMLSVEYDKTVASGARWVHHYLDDPDEGAVMAQLTSRGYTASEARGMVELCGTRLRLLEKPLRDGVDVVDHATFMQSAIDLASSQYSDLFSALEAPDLELLGSFLDSVEESESNGGAAAVRVNLRNLPRRLRDLDLSKVLYLRYNRTFVFQSRLHRNVWEKLRSEYVVSES